MQADNPIAALPPGRTAADAMAAADRLLGSPSLLPGEKLSDYNALRSQMMQETQPKGFLETLLVRDVVNSEWDILRLHRLKIALLRAKAHEGVREILAPFGDEDDDDMNALPDRWARGDPEARKEVGRLLKSAGLTVDAIVATTLAGNLDTVERIDGLLAAAEARRNKAFLEIDRHRQALGTAVRAAIQQVEDAEYKVVDDERPPEAA
jgi:hypothetical protein